MALVGYFTGALVAARIGEFPVPLLGFGASPTVGAFLGLAALRRLQLVHVPQLADARAASSRSMATKSVTPGSQPCCMSSVVI